MKLNIYSVEEKDPPVDEVIIRFRLNDDSIVQLKFDTASIAIPEEDELEFILSNVHKQLVWDSGEDMLLTDLWSYTTVSTRE
jgi:hypothetical protein